MKFPFLAALLGLLATFPAHAQTDAPSEIVKAWKARIAARIASNKYFPAEGFGQAGNARVAFAIDRSGRLISRALAESSGSRALDDAALMIIARADPFPEPPSELQDDSFSFTVPLNFVGQRFKVPPFGLTLSGADPAHPESDPLAAWHKAVTEHVWRNRTFPPEAMGQRANVGVTFVIDCAGKLISNALVESTGSAPLDAAALKMVERSEPFPKPPPETKDDLQRITFHMTFDGTQPVDGPWADEAKLKAKLNSVCRGC